MPDELMVSIEKLIYGGDGLAHADGNTIFVPYVLPGEEVRASTKSKKKKLIWANLLEVTSPAKQREQPRCPHFQTCGGCHYQHISATEQLRLKTEILRETLSRLGGIKPGQSESDTAVTALESLHLSVPQTVGVRPAVDHEDRFGALALDVDVDTPRGNQAAHRNPRC